MASQLMDVLLVELTDNMEQYLKGELTRLLQKYTYELGRADGEIVARRLAAQDLYVELVEMVEFLHEHYEWELGLKSEKEQ